MPTIEVCPWPWRMNAEEIAFQNGAPAEGAAVGRRLQQAVANTNAIAQAIDLQLHSHHAMHRFTIAP